MGAELLETVQRKTTNTVEDPTNNAAQREAYWGPAYPVYHRQG